jgi:ABC-type phosphate/phosphonate transport system substrate-binding protein
MAMENRNPAPVGETRRVTTSRRHALALMLGASRWLSAAPLAAEGSAPLRLAISENVVGEVNLNDARVAMQVWMKRMAQDMNLVVEYDPKVFETTPEILSRARRGLLDAVALNVIEYRQIADALDSSQVIANAGVEGPERYVILAKQNSAIQRLGDLRGRRLILLQAPRMCVAAAWLSTILDEGHFGPSEQFFGAVSTDPKVSRVVLPVFFGQADACLTSKRGFDTMCELNPQVAKDLKSLAISPPMVVTFYVFRKNYQSVFRERLVKALSGLRNTAAGRQFATLFQFEEAVVRDAGCLAPALAILDAADRARGRRGLGVRKG